MYIHDITDEMSESLIDMLNSDDKSDVVLALEIINNVDLNKGKNAEYISHIVHSTDFTFIDADTEAGTFSVSHLALFKGDDFRRYK